MPFVFKCRHCQKPVSAQADQRGLMMACPHCAGQFMVPVDSNTETRTQGVTDPLTGSSAFRDYLPPFPTTALTTAHLRFSFTCLRCGSILEASGDMCGHRGRCPTCGVVFTVPQVDRQTGVAMTSAEVADDGQLPTPMHAYANAGERAPKVVRNPDGSQAIVCPRCARHMPVDANICTACGIPFTMEGASTVIQGSSALNPLAGWALTIGVCSVLTFCLPVLGPLAIGVGWTALKRAKVYGNRGGRGMAITGIVLGAISLGCFGLFCYIKYF
jgi:DNA-directed RNA polymerase subunit RPC12/RpoP